MNTYTCECGHVNDWPSKDLPPWKAEGHTTDCAWCEEQVRLVYNAIDGTWKGIPSAQQEAPIIPVMPKPPSLADKFKKKDH